MKRTVILFFMCMILAAAAMAQSQKEQYKSLVERLLNAQINCDLNEVANVLDKNVKGYLFGEPWFDYDEVITLIKEWKGTGIKIEFEEWVIEGNKVVAKWTAHFTTGVYKGLTLAVIEDDKIIEWWAYLKKMGEQVDMH